MKNFTIVLLSLALFSACKNDTAANKAENTSTTEAQQAPAISAEELTTAANSSTQKVENMRNLAKEIDALPSKVKNDKEVQVIREELTDLIAKSEMMATELSNASKAGAGATDAKGAAVPPSDAQNGPIDPTLAKDYIESLQRYEQAANEMKSKLEAKKKN